MPRLQFTPTKWIITGLLSTAIITSVLPSSAEAQVFRGRVRNWLRGDPAREERNPPDDRVIIERHFIEPRIVMPNDYEGSVEARPRYRADDYGAGVSERGVRESRLSIRRRAAQSDDTYDYPAEQRTVRELDSRRSVLRAPEDRWQRDDVVVERRSRQVDADYDDVDRREADDSVDAESRRGERTVRVDRFENSRSISPAEDPYETEVTSRDDLPLRDARGRGEEELADDLPPPRPARPRSDDRVRPAAAEAAAATDAEEANELPAAVDRTRPEAIDDFDMPRAARDPSAKEDDEPAASEVKRPAKQPPQKPAAPAAEPRPKPAADDELLPPPPTDE